MNLFNKIAEELEQFNDTEEAKRMDRWLEEEIRRQNDRART